MRKWTNCWIFSTTLTFRNIWRITKSIKCWRIWDKEFNRWNREQERMKTGERNKSRNISKIRRRRSKKKSKKRMIFWAGCLEIRMQNQRRVRKRRRGWSSWRRRSRKKSGTGILWAKRSLMRRALTCRSLKMSQTKYCGTTLRWNTTATSQFVSCWRNKPETSWRRDVLQFINNISDYLTRKNIHRIKCQ